MLIGFGYDNYIEEREKYMKQPHKINPFSSSRKRSSVIIMSQGGCRAHVTGASEIVLNSCQ